MKRFRPAMRVAPHRFVLALVLAVLIMVEIGLDPTTLAAAPVPRRGGTLVVGIWQEPVTMIWARRATPYAMSMLVMRALNEPLLGVDEKNQFVPRMLAEVPTMKNGGVSPDGLSYTLKLRPGLKWQDGHPVTMRDFVFTWKWIVDPRNAASYRLGWEEISSVDLSPDGLTGVVKLKQLYVPFPENVLATGFLLPEHHITRVGDREATRNPVTAGPFRLVEWVSGSSLTLERNPNYWQRGKPYLDRIIFKVLPDRSVMFVQAQTGDVRMAVDFSEAQIGDLEKLSDVRLVRMHPATLERWLFNVNDPQDLNKPHPIFSDVRTRQAVIFATDRPTILRTVLKGMTTPAVNKLMNTPWFNKDLRSYVYDPALAKQLLERAGWRPGPDGIRVKEGVRFSFTHSTTTADPTRDAIQVIMQQNLRDVGIEMKLQNYPPSRFFGLWASGGIIYRRQFDMAAHSNGLQGLDPDLYTWWHSSQVPSERNTAGLNYTGWTSPELDKILEQVNQTIEPVKRKQLLDRAQRIVHNAYVVMPMYNRVLLVSAHKTLHGLQPINAQAFVGLMANVEDWWMDR